MIRVLLYLLRTTVLYNRPIQVCIVTALYYRVADIPLHESVNTRNVHLLEVDRIPAANTLNAALTVCLIRLYILVDRHACIEERRF